MNPTAANDGAADLNEGPAEYGTLLSERRESRALAWTVLVVVMGLIAIGVRAAAVNGEWGILAVLGGIAAVFGSAAVWDLYRKRHALRFFERGVVRGSKSLAYSAIDSMLVKRVRHFYKGIYCGSTVTIDLRPRKAGPGRRMRATFKYKEKCSGLFRRSWQSQDDIDPLTNVVAMEAAVAWDERLNAGEMIKWCPGAIFTRDTVEVRPLIGKSRSIPWSDITALGLKRGKAVVQTASGQDVCFSATGLSRNFDVGMQLIRLRAGLRGVEAEPLAA